jgi:hypothetical protein
MLACPFGEHRVIEQSEMPGYPGSFYESEVKKYDEKETDGLPISWCGPYGPFSIFDDENVHLSPVLPVSRM